MQYLANIQHDSGYWGSPEDVHDKYGHVAVGKTGLCVLAFMGAGHTQSSGSRYSEVIEKSMNEATGIAQPTASSPRARDVRICWRANATSTAT